MIPNESSRLDLTATQRMAGATVTQRAARKTDREALDAKPPPATTTED